MGGRGSAIRAIELVGTGETVRDAPDARSKDRIVKGNARGGRLYQRGFGPRSAVDHPRHGRGLRDDTRKDCCEKHGAGTSLESRSAAPKQLDRIGVGQALFAFRSFRLKAEATDTERPLALAEDAGGVDACGAAGGEPAGEAAD